MENIILVGSSGHAKVIVDIVEKQGKYNVVGFLDAFRAVGEETLGYPVLGAEADLPRLANAHDIQGVIVAIGDNSLRAKVAAKVLNFCPGLSFVTAIHPAASIGKGTSIGDGTVVMAGAVINPCCQVGRFCIVNTGASLDHDCVMDDFSSLAPGATTGGNCRIGTCAAIGIGASLKHGITIGEHSVIGAGSMVLKVVKPFSVSYGCPAKVVRSREEGDKYL